MSDTLSEFTPEQLAQLVEYLRFEQHKRREIRAEISGELTDLLNAEVDSTTIYSGKDAIELLAKLPALLDNTISSELERSRDINVVLLDHILQQAQASGIILTINIPDLYNESLTDQANQLCGRLLANGDQLIAGKATPKTGNEEESGVSLDEIKAENERLKAQLKRPKREWPEFLAVTQQLKDRNAEIHRLRAQLGE
jgi:vacuolar-type H+-ATPase subunit I/STV1